MNKEEVVKEIITILDTSSYIDPAEHLYDGLKQIKREITYATVHDFLWALESSTVIDVDGRVTECAKKIKPLLADIIDEVYVNYLKNWKPQPVVENELHWMEQELVSDRPLPKDMFIHCIKKDSEFSEDWGLKIEERELSLEERLELWFQKNQSETGKRGIWEIDYIENYEGHKKLNSYNIPAKLITITYNNEKIEIYE